MFLFKLLCGAYDRAKGPIRGQHRVETVSKGLGVLGEMLNNSNALAYCNFGLMADDDESSMFNVLAGGD